MTNELKWIRQLFQNSAIKTCKHGSKTISDMEVGMFGLNLKYVKHLRKLTNVFQDEFFIFLQRIQFNLIIQTILAGNKIARLAYTRNCNGLSVQSKLAMQRKKGQDPKSYGNSIQWISTWAYWELNFYTAKEVFVCGVKRKVWKGVFDKI